MKRYNHYTINSNRKMMLGFDDDDDNKDEDSNMDQ
jgi:hypothetical protein